MKVNLPKLEARELGRPRFRVRNPIVPGQLYAFRQPQWDYYGVTVAAAVTEQRLFQLPLGQNYTPAGGVALVKSLWHTNMTNAGVIPNPNKLFVKGISLAVATDIAIADARRFLSDTLLRFIIGDRDFTDLHVWKAPAAGGVFTASVGAVNNGFPGQSEFFKPEGPLGEVIEQLQNFAVILDPTRVIRADAGATFTTATAAAGGTGINAHVYLDGIFSRVVL